MHTDPEQRIGFLKCQRRSEGVHRSPESIHIISSKSWNDLSRDFIKKKHGTAFIFNWNMVTVIELLRNC